MIDLVLRGKENSTKEEKFKEKKLLHNKEKIRIEMREDNRKG
jgi:hypothetical protein